jgi:F-type H+-transporting ATPase subunit delta
MANDVNSAAAVYAESLLQLAHELGKAEEIGQELADLRELWRNDPDFAAIMSSAAIDEDARRETIRKLLAGRVHPYVLNLLMVLNDKRRSAILPAVVESYRNKLDGIMNRSAVYVTAAVPISDEQRQRITAGVEKLTGRQARMIEKIDPAVLSGLIVQVGDQLYDFSGRRRLRDLTRSLHESVRKHMLGGADRFIKE